MYRAIGFLVVAGFALFGITKFIEDHVTLGGEDTDELAGDAGKRPVNTLGEDPA